MQGRGGQISIAEVERDWHFAEAMSTSKLRIPRRGF